MAIEELTLGEVESAPLQHDDGNDYTMTEEGSFWVTIENLALYVVRSEEGVSVSICARFPTDACADNSNDLAQAYASFADAPDEDDADEDGDEADEADGDEDE